MSMTWEEPGAGGALKKSATKVAALALLAVVGAAGGAGIALWTADAGVVNASATAKPSAATAVAETDRPDAVAEPVRKVEAAEKSAPTADMFGPPQLAALSLPRVTGRSNADADPARRAELAAVAEVPENEIDAGETASIPPVDDPVAIAESEDAVAALEAQMAEAGTKNFVPPDPDAKVELVLDEPVGEEVEGATELPVEQAAAEIVEEPVAETASAEEADRRGPKGEALSPAQAAKYVNLRAEPGNDGEVLSVVPANADILAEQDCRHWCAVVHDGQAGYVYHAFIAGRS